MKVTINEVAKRAGVCKSTVSNVLNNKDCVADETKIKVLKICNELNFSQNSIATSLATKKTGVIGLFLQVEGHGYQGFFNDIIESVTVYCEKYGYRVMLFLSVSSDEMSKLLKYGKAPIDAAIVLNPMVNDYRIDEMQNDLIPYVLIGSPNNISLNSTNCVDVDNFKVVYDLTLNMLKNSDTKKILLLNSPNNLTISRDRESGFLRAFVNNKIDLSNAIVYNRQTDNDYSNIRNIIMNNHDIKGIITESDEGAKDVYDILAERRIEIGKDVSVVALGGTEICDILNPKLSHVLIDYKTIGYYASRKLIKVMNGETPDYTVEYVDTKLILTNSYINFE